MRKLKSAVIAGVTFALAGCSEAERRDTGEDLQAAAQRVESEVADAVDSPELREVGAEIKQAAGDAGQVIKDTAQGAVEGAREGAAKVERETDASVDEAQR